MLKISTKKKKKKKKKFFSMTIDIIDVLKNKKSL